MASYGKKVEWPRCVLQRSTGTSFWIGDSRNGKPNRNYLWHLCAVLRATRPPRKVSASYAPLAVVSPTQPTGGAFSRRWALGLAHLGRRGVGERERITTLP